MSDSEMQAVSGPEVDARPRPGRIGRYEILAILGEGSFGRVYLGHDDVLDRRVAIKVPHRERIAQPEDVEAYLAEAKILAHLDHSGIVPVYDVGRTEDGLCFVVSKWIEGRDLAQRLKEGRPDQREAVELVAAVAHALHHAHLRGLVHRDIKPANILVDDHGRPYVADFGLALKDADFGRGARYAGTPAYMSPEQARGEGHRVDGRSDIFSLGVVFYEMLTGRRLFRCTTHRELLDEIASADPRPPRQVDDTIPKELERICLRAIARRASERYPTAKDLADDLHHFLETPAAETSRGSGASHVADPLAQSPPALTPVSAPSSLPGAPVSNSRPLRIVPKGLRSFDEHDADFFLELLPGPHDRDGLPESLRFWKIRIDEQDPDRTFGVGLIYGPSGCGKSSLVKAGLLPRLAPSVDAIYLEARAEGIETRILNALRKACPELPLEFGLVESLAAIRRGQVTRAGRKILLVLDQFEQWLHACHRMADSELVTALRQCDGGRVQAIVMVRDDFWMAANRFARELEVDLMPGHNIAAVDLFDRRHAKGVLAAFGHAFGALARDGGKHQEEFLNRAMDALSEQGKIIPVRLSLFAEMLKGKSWTTATLRAVGGAQGVGIAFLEESFGTASANPKHRLHQQAARSILKALLPESGSTLKGHVRTEAELSEAAGYGGRPRDLADVLHILDRELRLITPANLEETNAGGDRRSLLDGSRSYQLTHDYLIPSLRDWLSRKERETRSGRAQIRLEERAALWQSRPEDRHLPSIREGINIRLLTHKAHWTEPQARMMNRALRRHVQRAVGLAALVALVAWLGSEGYGALRAAAIVDSLAHVETSDVPRLVQNLAPHHRHARPLLSRLVSDPKSDARSRLHASLALLPSDNGQVEYLSQRLLDASPIELSVIWQLLRDHPQAPVARLWAVLEDPDADPDARFRAACALANDHATAASHRWVPVARLVSDGLVRAIGKDLSHSALLLDMLHPVRDQLIAPLCQTFGDATRPESERSLATGILADYAGDRPGVLLDLLLEASASQFGVLMPKVQARSSEMMPLLGAALAEGPASGREDDRIARRRARAVVALLELGRAEALWPWLQHRPDPGVRSYLIHWLKPLGVSPAVLIEKLATLTPSPPARPAVDSMLFHPTVSVRRALILALGEYSRKDLPGASLEQVADKLLETYRDDPDPGIHAAAEWTLRRWGLAGRLTSLDDALLNRRTDHGERLWLLNGQRQTFTVIAGPSEFLMGSPSTEADHFENEAVHRTRIDHSFVLAAKEVTVAQYARFVEEHPEHAISDVTKYSPDPDGPQAGISWYSAAAYCNWLSGREGLDQKTQWCFEPNAEGKYAEGMKIAAHSLDRRGYRLPTEEEWEFACRAGAGTSRFYGESPELLVHYAWYARNSEYRTWPGGRVKPNDLGLFDMLGNVYEWCQYPAQAYPLDGGPKTKDPAVSGSLSDRGLHPLRGGAFTNPPGLVRSASRSAAQQSYQYITGGLRLARSWR